MQLKKIKVNHWYETKVGVGKVERVGGCFPVACRIVITYPIPRGVCNVVPRDFIREVPEFDDAETEPQRAFDAPGFNRKEGQ